MHKAIWRMRTDGSSGGILCWSNLFYSTSRVSKSPRGLPWWCVLVGWLLVATTSGVAAFFTMLYGLHYGRVSSLKWLISMAVSFVESVFITQPLKVRTPHFKVSAHPCYPPLPSCGQFFLKHSYYFFQCSFGKHMGYYLCSDPGAGISDSTIIAQKDLSPSTRANTSVSSSSLGLWENV